MRDLLDLYVRSLAEREDAGDAPEYRQDLGTFLDWLLEQLGFTVYMHSYKRTGIARRKSSGDKQLGVDILATKEISDTNESVFLFVLKHGDIGRAEWAAGVAGKLQQDLWSAAGRSPEIDKWFAPTANQWTQRTVVVVHNGDLDKTDLGSMIDSDIRKIKSQYNVEVEWWDADRLVELAMRSDSSILEGSILPPAARPFIRMSIDSLRRAPDGRAFDIGGVDQYLEQLLPGDAPLTKDRNTPPLLRVRRQISELGLAASIIIEQAQRVARGTSLPALDGLERMICRAMVWLQRLPPEDIEQLAEAAKPSTRKTKGHETRVLRALHALLDQYTGIAIAFAKRLEIISRDKYGLALALPSEPIDYPLRVLRFSGYLAMAGLLLYEKNDAVQARLLAVTILNIWTNNEGGALSPITDDQIIEIGIVFELWLSLGMNTEVSSFAGKIFKRYMQRQEFGAPFPAIWMRASIPMKEKDLRTLNEAHSTGIEQRPAGFTDDSTTVLPVLIYILHRSGSIVPNEQISLLLGIGEKDTKSRRRLCFQTWIPPENAPEHWYARSVTDQGDCHVYSLHTDILLTASDENSMATRMTQEYERISKKPLQGSLAKRLNLSAIDRIAWKRWRIPPPSIIYTSKI